MDDYFIRYLGLHKSFEEKEVLLGVDLEIGRGETVVVLGGSGSGKSVLIRHTIGLHRPDAGEVWVDGQRIDEFSEEELIDTRKKVLSVSTPIFASPRFSMTTPMAKSMRSPS